MRKLTIMGLLLMMMQTLCVKAQITRGYFTVPSEGQFYLYSIDQPGKECVNNVIKQDSFLQYNML